MIETLPQKAGTIVCASEHIQKGKNFTILA
jgi:hypothetical protein